MSHSKVSLPTQVPALSLVSSVVHLVAAAAAAVAVMLPAVATAQDNAKPDLAAGEQIAATVCVACHGADGKGNPLLGAPNLTDRTWLYGGSEASIIESITNGRSGTMPAHENRLTPQQIDLLVAYVLNVSGSAGK